MFLLLLEIAAVVVLFGRVVCPHLFEEVGVARVIDCVLFFICIVTTARQIAVVEFVPRVFHTLFFSRSRIPHPRRISLLSQRSDYVRQREEEALL